MLPRRQAKQLKPSAYRCGLDSQFDNVLSFQIQLNVMKPTAEQTEFTERVGRWWETTVGSRTAGRILGWLMICDPAHQSSQDLAEAVQASAGSVSTQTRQLEAFGLIEKVTFPGDRSTYYQLRPHVWEQMLWEEHQRIRDMRDIAIAGESVLPADRPDRVKGLRRTAEFLIEEWPGLMERLRTRSGKEKAS